MFAQFSSWKKHHSIEFFGVLLILLLSLLVVDVAGSLTHTASADRDYLSENPYYAKRFTTSLSGLTGDIVGFYTNADHSKCGIMVKIDDILNMSTDANDYEIWFRGFNVSKGTYTNYTANRPSGGYYVFGATGYAMIYLVNTGGFKEQACEVVIRSNKTLVKNETTSGDLGEAMQALKKKDLSYSKYDQYRLIINPSASGATVVDFLDDIDIMAAYRYCVLDAQEDSVRAKLYSDIGIMNDSMRQINEYKKNLNFMNVRVPDLSEYIAGDRFVNCPDGENGVCECSDVEALPYVTTDKDTGEIVRTVYPVYIPGMVASRGVDFDWQHHRLSDDGVDFFDGLLLDGQTKDRFLKALPTLSTVNYNTVPNISQFSMLDGTPLSESMRNSGRTDEVQIYNLVQSYIGAVSTYVSTKNQYQVTDLVKYLTLQYNMEVSGQAFTSNFTDGIVHIWS